LDFVGQHFDTVVRQQSATPVEDLEALGDVGEPGTYRLVPPHFDR